MEGFDPTSIGRGLEGLDPDVVAGRGWIQTLLMEGSDPDCNWIQKLLLEGLEGTSIGRDVERCC